MKIVGTLCSFVLMAGCAMAVMALAVDAWEWETTGACEEALVIHHIRDCRR